MDNRIAFEIIEKSNITEENKNFLKSHIQNIGDYAEIMSQHNDFICRINNADASLLSAKEDLCAKYDRLIGYIDQVDQFLKDAICEECGHKSKQVLQKLATYIALINKKEELDDVKE